MKKNYLLTLILLASSFSLYADLPHTPGNPADLAYDELLTASNQKHEEEASKQLQQEIECAEGLLNDQAKAYNAHLQQAASHQKSALCSLFAYMAFFAGGCVSAVSNDKAHEYRPYSSIQEAMKNPFDIPKILLLFGIATYFYSVSTHERQQGIKAQKDAHHAKIEAQRTARHIRELKAKYC